MDELEKEWNEATQIQSVHQYDTPVKLVTTKPDTELAKELKDELTQASEAWLKACTKAHALGFEVAANFAPNYLG